MDLKITNEQQNPLFNRKEVFATVESTIIPTKQDVANALAEKYKVDSTALRVLDVKGKFGSQEFTIRANVYPSQEERNNTEALTKKEKEAEAKAAEPAQEEAKPAEKPVEEKSESIPAEKAIGLNPVEEAKKLEAKRAEEDKKEKEKTPKEKEEEK